MYCVYHALPLCYCYSIAMLLLHYCYAIATSILTVVGQFSAWQGDASSRLDTEQEREQEQEQEKEVCAALLYLAYSLNVNCILVYIRRFIYLHS
jgi:hypothetical protein